LTRRHHLFGHHVRGHLAGQEVPQVRRVDIGRDDDGGGQPPWRAEGHHDRPAHGRVPLQRRLDLTEFDPVPANLHLGISAAEKLHRTVGVVPGQVAGPVPAHPAEFDERARRALRVAPVAVGHRPSADPQLAGDPVGPVPAGPVGHPHVLVGEWQSVRHRPPGRWYRYRYHLDGGVNGGLRGAAERHQGGRRSLRGQPAREVETDPVTAEQCQPQREAGLVRRGRGGQQHVEQRGNGLPDGDPVPQYQLPPVLRVASVLLADTDHRAADGQQGEDVVDRQVKVERGDGERPVRGTDLESLIDVIDGVDGRPVCHLHALRLAGRAGGEQQVGQVVLAARHGCDRRGGPVVDVDDADVGRQSGRRHNRHHMAHSGNRVDPVASGGGLVDADRHVNPAGAQDRQHRHDLSWALVDGDRHRVAAAHAVSDEGGRDPVGPFGELAVGEQPVGVPEQRGPVRLRSGSGEDVLVQPPTAYRTGGVVDRGAYLAGVRGQQFRGFSGPVRVVAQPAEHRQVRLEHVADQAAREEAVHHVPVQIQAVFPFGDLYVEPDLRGLRHCPPGGAEALPDLAFEEFAETERAGEDDRGADRFLAAPTGQVA